MWNYQFRALGSGSCENWIKSLPAHGISVVVLYLIQVGKSQSGSQKKSEEMFCFEVLEGWGGVFSCSLDVLYGGLGINRLKFDQKI
jgi:hypothetical protein